MLNDNIIMLRNINGYSQEYVAEMIGISRQAYAKWEKGETIPDVVRCQKLADLYGTTIDALIKSEYQNVGNMVLAPAPKGKHILGTTKINDHGQIVIPKIACEILNIKPNDALVVLVDEAEGIAILKADMFEQQINQALAEAKKKIDE